MSIWNSVNPEVSVDGNCFVDVATATSWNDKVRLAIVDADYSSTELTIEQAKQLVTDLNIAIERVEKKGHK